MVGVATYHSTWYMGYLIAICNLLAILLNYGVMSASLRYYYDQGMQEVLESQQIFTIQHVTLVIFCSAGAVLYVWVGLFCVYRRGDRAGSMRSSRGGISYAEYQLKLQQIKKLQQEQVIQFEQEMEEANK